MAERMATRQENERLAILETEMKANTKAVTDLSGKFDVLDGKVDAILIHQAQGTGALAFISKIAPWAAVLIAVIALVVPK